jgi:hypothetical protein
MPKRTHRPHPQRRSIRSVRRNSLSYSKEMRLRIRRPGVQIPPSALHGNGPLRPSSGPFDGFGRSTMTAIHGRHAKSVTIGHVRGQSSGVRQGPDEVTDELLPAALRRVPRPVDDRRRALHRHPADPPTTPKPGAAARRWTHSWAVTNATRWPRRAARDAKCEGQVGLAGAGRDLPQACDGRGGREGPGEESHLIGRDLSPTEGYQFDPFPHLVEVQAGAGA